MKLHSILLFNAFLLLSFSSMAANVFYYLPDVGFIGDPMPFYDEAADKFRIYYLQEFRPNAYGTYHPVYAVETSNLVTYNNIGEVLPTGQYKDQDAAIGTGSVIYCDKDSLYYFFYTGNKAEVSAQESRQVVMYATSKDGVHWTKSDFRLNGHQWYYYKDDFRDPEVFLAEDGLYHMLVATGKDGRNVLAEFTSPDCKQWTNQGIFMTTMWDRFYECPNVFKMGDWWYLIYSDIHKEIRKVQYFKATSYADLAKCTKNDVAIWPDNHEGYLDSRGLYAGKTASDGKNRYLWGWCPTRPNNDNTIVNNSNGEPDWAGTLVAHRLIQHADGTLTLGEIDSVKSYFNHVEPLSSSMVELNAGQSCFMPEIANQTHMHFKLSAKTSNAKFGVSLVRDTNTSCFYSVIVNPENNNLRKVNFEQEGGKGFIAYIDGYFFTQPSDNIYTMDIYIDNSVFVLYINDKVCYTNRVYGMQSHQWSINCYSGSIKVEDIYQKTHSDDPSHLPLCEVNNLDVRKYVQHDGVSISNNGNVYSITGQTIESGTK